MRMKPIVEINLNEMRIVAQRSKEASVAINGEIQGAIEHGMVILLGIEHDDDTSDADWLIQKIIGLRIFADEEGKMNRSIIEKGGAILLISQFTLHASTKKGNRPSFIKAARPEQAIPLYEYVIQQLKQYLRVETGTFGADMQVALINDGPVTITIDSKQKE
jgi:D-tyrosyl-tRNA(Tyr) deacylase